VELFSFRDIFQVGGFTMVVLFFCSIIVLAVIIERIFVFREFSAEFKRFKETLGNPENKDTPIISSLITDINSLKKLDAAKEERLHTANILRLSTYLDKRLPVLATIGSMAPFIGLFGTVLGIMRAFNQISAAKGAGIEVVGTGIAEALVCTAAGLFVAIISVISYNLFKTKTKRISDEFDIVITSYLAEL